MAPTERYHVPAGTFRTSRSSRVVLQAYVGSCVALALYCRKTRIGGVLHVLLPKTSGLGTIDHPAKYAATGVPLLIETLVDMGADVAHMEASAARGALIAPLQDQDLVFDIGGRRASPTHGFYP